MNSLTILLPSGEASRAELPGYRRLSAHVTAEMEAMIAHEARRRGMSQAQTIRELIALGLECQAP